MSIHPQKAPPSEPLDGGIGFLDARRFPYTELLESSYRAIKEELMSVLPLPRWSAYLDHDPRRGRAMLFLLYVRGRPNTRNCRLCPATAAVLARVPNLRQAAFAYLPPGARIAPHRGAPGILRVHLGLLCEDTLAGWRAAGRTERSVEGKVTIFHDGSLHEAWNEGSSPRVTLVCDPPAPAPRERELAGVLKAYEDRYGLPYLLRTHGRSRPSGHPYNRWALPTLLAVARAIAPVEGLLLPFVLFGYNRLEARHVPAASSD